MSNKEQKKEQKSDDKSTGAVDDNRDEDDDELLSKEETEFRHILEHKFALFKEALVQWLDHGFVEARITAEQGRRVAEYAHKTFFKHVRLYDFVLKNTKLSEVKRVQLFIEEPKCGADLSKAMVLQDSTMKTPRVQVDLSGGDLSQNQLAQGNNSTSMMQDSKMSGKQSYATGSLSKAGLEGQASLNQQQNDQTSATDSDMDEVVRQANLDKKSKKIIHRAAKDWDGKIAAQLSKGATDDSAGVTND